MTDIQIAICIIVACAIACYVIVLALPIERESDWVGDTLLSWDEPERNAEYLSTVSARHREMLEAVYVEYCEYYHVTADDWDEPIVDLIMAHVFDGRPATAEQLADAIEQELHGV